MSNAIAEAAAIAAGEAWVRCSVGQVDVCYSGHVWQPSKTSTEDHRLSPGTTHIHYDNEINALHISLYNVFYYIHNF